METKNKQITDDQTIVNKKTFKFPKIEIITFEVDDVIRTSGNDFSNMLEDD